MSGSSVSIYFLATNLEWLDEEARKRKRSRSELINLIIEDLRSGWLAEKEEEEEKSPTPILRKAF